MIVLSTTRAAPSSGSSRVSRWIFLKTPRGICWAFCAYKRDMVLKPSARNSWCCMLCTLPLMHYVEPQASQGNGRNCCCNMCTRVPDNEHLHSKPCVPTWSLHGANVEDLNKLMKPWLAMLQTQSAARCALLPTSDFRLLVAGTAGMHTTGTDA